MDRNQEYSFDDEEVLRQLELEDSAEQELETKAVEATAEATRQDPSSTPVPTPAPEAPVVGRKPHRASNCR